MKTYSFNRKVYNEDGSLAQDVASVGVLFGRMLRTNMDPKADPVKFNDWGTAIGKEGVVQLNGTDVEEIKKFAKELPLAAFVRAQILDCLKEEVKTEMSHEPSSRVD